MLGQGIRGIVEAVEVEGTVRPLGIDGADLGRNGEAGAQGLLDDGLAGAALFLVAIDGVGCHPGLDPFVGSSAAAAAAPVEFRVAGDGDGPVEVFEVEGVGCVDEFVVVAVDAVDVG